MTCTCQLTVRSYECDSYNHVNNANYLNYLEYGRLEFLRQVGFNYKNFVKAGFYIYVTHVDIFYKASALLDDTLYIDTTPVKMGAVRGVFHQVIRKADGTICSMADVTWACVNKDGQPCQVPQDHLVTGLIPSPEDAKKVNPKHRF